MTRSNEIFEVIFGIRSWYWRFFSHLILDVSSPSIFSPSKPFGGYQVCLNSHFNHSEQLPNPGCYKRPTKYRMAYHQSLTSSRPSLCSSSILFLVFDMQYRLNNNGKSCIPNSIKSQPYLDVKYFKVFFFVFLNRAVPLSQRERYYSRASGKALFFKSGGNGGYCRKTSWAFRFW